MPYKPNLDLRQVATLEDTLRQEDSTKVYNCATYLQRIRKAADNCDTFSNASGGNIAARKVFTHEFDDPMTHVFAHSRLNNSG